MNDIDRIKQALIIAYIGDVECTLTNSDCNELTKYIAQLENSGMRLEVAEKYLRGAAEYGMGIGQARRYFGQDHPWRERQDPPGYDEFEYKEKNPWKT